VQVLRNEWDSDIRTIVDGDDDGNLFIRHEQEVAPIIDHNRKISNHVGKAIPKNKDNLRWIARIPSTVLHDLMFRGVISEGADGWHVMNEKTLRKVLNDPDFRGLRTCEGRV
jgi:hypothetical protein